MNLTDLKQKPIVELLDLAVPHAGTGAADLNAYTGAGSTDAVSGTIQCDPISDDNDLPEMILAERRVRRDDPRAGGRVCALKRDAGAQQSERSDCHERRDARSGRNRASNHCGLREDEEIQC